MQIHLDHRSRMVILSALHQYSQTRCQNIPNSHVIVDYLCEQLQPSGKATDVGMGDVVVWNGELHEVIIAYERECNVVVIAPVFPKDEESEDSIQLPWSTVKKSELNWPEASQGIHVVQALL